MRTSTLSKNAAALFAVFIGSSSGCGGSTESTTGGVGGMPGTTGAAMNTGGANPQSSSGNAGGASTTTSGNAGGASATTSGNTSSSSTSSTSSGGATRDPEGNDNACVTCAKTKCCAEYTACQADKTCLCWYVCQRLNPGDLQGCFVKCGAPSEATKQIGMCGQANCENECKPTTGSSMN